MFSPFLGNKRQVAHASISQNKFFMGKENFMYCKATCDVSVGPLCGAALYEAFVAWVSLVSIFQAGAWASLSTPARHYFSTYITTTDQHLCSI